MGDSGRDSKQCYRLLTGRTFDHRRQRTSRRIPTVKDRIKISTGAPWERIIGYSRAVRVGDRVWVAGTTSVDADGSVYAPGDAYRQAVRSLEIIQDALIEVGAEVSDAVRTRIYLVDIGDWEAVGRAHGEVFHAVRPASTLVQVSGLIAQEMLVEIEVEAVISPSRISSPRRITDSDSE